MSWSAFPLTQRFVHSGLAALRTSYAVVGGLHHIDTAVQPPIGSDELQTTTVWMGFSKRLLLLAAGPRPGHPRSTDLPILHSLPFIASYSPPGRLTDRNGR